jgi:hypothetical protein
VGLNVTKHVMDSSLREWFHGAAVTAGGERSCISGAVSLSMAIIGPPHWGQRQRSAELLVEEASGWADGFCAGRASESKAAGAWHVGGWPKNQSFGCVRSPAEADATGSSARTHGALRSATSVHCCEQRNEYCPQRVHSSTSNETVSGSVGSMASRSLRPLPPRT